MQKIWVSPISVIDQHRATRVRARLNYSRRLQWTRGFELGRKFTRLSDSRVRPFGVRHVIGTIPIRVSDTRRILEFLFHLVLSLVTSCKR